MKKVYVSGLYRQEILDSHILNIQDYVEAAIQTFVKDFMGANDGVLFGLQPSITVGGQSVTIASGTVLQDGLYGELTEATGFVVSKPLSGTRTDMIVASYEEAFADYASGFVLLDTATRVEQVVTLPNTKQGQIKFEQLQNTTIVSVPSGKIPVCQITLSTSAITSLVDARTYTKIQKAISSSFSNLFYGSM
jgi:hypothetical protein